MKLPEGTRVVVCAGRLDGRARPSERALAEDGREGVVTLSNRATVRADMGKGSTVCEVEFPRVMLRPLPSEARGRDG